MSSEEHSWVFDSLIGFLGGPLWKAPLESFIDEKSLIFEPNNNDAYEHQKVFEEFKGMVDYMLGTYMADIGITAEQFEISCGHNIHEKIPPHMQEKLFQQIWAANDYAMFKQMMMQKNVELQLEALELIENKCGITPQIFIPIKSSLGSKSTDDKAVGSSRSEDKILVDMIIHKEDIPEESTPIEERVEINSVQKQNEETVSGAAIKKRSLNVELNSDDIKKRQEYLYAQRDKLVAMKKKVNTKLIQNEAQSTEGQKRPQSARVAEAVIQGDMSGQLKNLDSRRALAEKLRFEVIGKKNK